MASECKSVLRGPERLTLIEQIIDISRIPFGLGCFLLAVIFGPPGAFLLTYIQSYSVSEALRRTLYLFFGQELLGFRGLVALTLFSVILFYFLYMIRFLRMRLCDAKTELLPLLPESEKTFQDNFNPVSNLRPPIMIGAILIILAQLQTYPELPENYALFIESYQANLIFVYVWLLFWLMVVGTFIWVYFGSIRGLYQLGTTSLKLKPYHEDKTLGTRPIGLLSLSFATIYIIGIGLALFLVLILLPNTTFPFFTSLLTVLMFIGIIFFFLPLYSVHKRMVEAKNLEQESVRRQLSKVFEGRKNEESENNISEALNRLTTIIAVDITKGELKEIPTWPVDVPIISRLITLIFSVIGILVANYLIMFVLDWK
jgi:hypothetical protein